MLTLPPFDIDGGWPLALARGLSVAGLFAIFGGLLAMLVVMPPALARLHVAAGRPVRSALQWLAWGGVALAVLATMAWVWLVAGTLADTPSLHDTAAVLPTLLWDTVFGHAVLLRLVALGLACVLVAWGRLRPACGCAALAVMLQAAHSHAASMQPGISLLLVSDTLHLLAGAAWLGGLLPLLLLVWLLPHSESARACKTFSGLGKLCVLVLAATAGLQGWTLIGGLPGWLGTGYGLVALGKAALFAVLLGFAAANLFRLTPALAKADAVSARRRMLRSIGGECAVGLGLVLVAGLLCSLPPSMHEQPLWPFPLRPSLVTIDEDPDFRREVLAALLALLGAAGLLAVALLAGRRRGLRIVAVAAAAVIAWRALPHLDILFVPAVPTAYQHSPTGFTAASIVRGMALYPQHCAACHGAGGQGDGPAAAALPIPPADLTAAHLWMHSDGDMIWWLSHGMQGPRGDLAMPGFAAALSETERWDLIDAIRARNAGLAWRTTGEWPVPLPAPDFSANCNGRFVHSLRALRGQIVRLAFGEPPPDADQAMTILASPEAPPESGLCVTRDPDVVRAYAIAAGRPAEQMSGLVALIDGNGWLRTVLPAAASSALAEWVKTIKMYPVPPASGTPDHMNMAM